MRTVDERDYAVLLELSKDARRSDAQIARNVDLSEKSVRTRIRRMIDDGVFRVMAVPNPWKVGYSICATIFLRVELSRVHEIERKLLAMPRVHFLALIAGRFDMAIWVTFASIVELAQFITNELSSVHGILWTETLMDFELKKWFQAVVSDGGFGRKQDHETHGLVSGRQDDAFVPEQTAIDDKDRRIIVELQNDGRQSDSAVARKLAMSQTTVRRRIVRLVQNGVISLSPVVIPEAVRYTMALCGIEADLSKLDSICQSLCAKANVQWVSLTVGRFDILASIASPANGGIANFVKNDLSGIPGIHRTETFIILDMKKRDPRIVPPL